MKTLKLVTLVEATTMNAVARIVLEFLRTAKELSGANADFPSIDGSIITFDRSADDDAPNEFVATARASGLVVDVVREQRRFDLSVIPALREGIDARRPDIVITNSVKSHFLFWRSRLNKNYPWVAFHHGYTTTDLKMRVYNRLDRWSLPKSDRVATVCQAFASQLSREMKIPQERIFVQHNAIRPQPKPATHEVNELRRRFGIAEAERVVLSIGRLSKEKAHADLIEAFKTLQVINSDLHCKLLLVGDGPERGSLETAARASGQNDRITFAGQVNDVQPFYAAADVFVLPSLSEGSPNVLLEAMAAEVPIVATAVGGVTEIVADEESALLVPPKNPHTLAAAIDRVLRDSSLAQRLTTVASALVAREHSPEAYARSLISLYQEVIEQRGALSHR
ncbi:MAG TPA: glycosyltransferase family 4 protein [Pyrinomonadaceae bacterium]|nr:glycosyltransferase family 4 protein [Pyrinomonadaceae bacterium]